MATSGPKVCPRCFSSLSSGTSVSLFPAVLKAVIENTQLPSKDSSSSAGGGSTKTSSRKATSPQPPPIAKSLTVTTFDGHEIELTVELGSSSSNAGSESKTKHHQLSSNCGSCLSLDSLKSLIAGEGAGGDVLLVPCLANHLSKTIKMYGVVDLAFMREKHVEGRYTVNSKIKNDEEEDCSPSAKEAPNALDDTALGCGDDVPVSQQRYSTVNSQWFALSFSFQPALAAAGISANSSSSPPSVEINVRLVTKVSTKEAQDFHPAEWFAAAFGCNNGANPVISALFATPLSATSAQEGAHEEVSSSQPPAEDGKKARGGKKAGKKNAAAASSVANSSEAAAALDTPTGSSVAVPALCGICEEEHGAVECIQCDFAICEGCLRSIHSKGKFKSHTTVPLGTLQANKPSMCSLHPDQELQLFCHDCGVPVCVSCIFLPGPHKGHQATPLQEEVNRVKKELKAQVDKLQAGAKYASALKTQLSQAEGKLDEDFKNLSDHIHEAFNRLRSELNKRESFLCDRASEIHSQKKLSLTRNSVVVQALCSEVDELHASCLKATDGGGSGGSGSGGALSGSNLLNIAPMIESRVFTLEQHRVLAEAFSNFGTTPLPPSLVNSPARGGNKKSGHDEDEDQRSSATESLNQQLALWARQYTPSLEDLSFRLRPDATGFEMSGGEAAGRDSTLSTTSSALLSTMEAKGDQAFAELISRAGELSYYPSGEDHNDAAGSPNQSTRREPIDLAERPCLSPTLQLQQPQTDNNESGRIQQQQQGGRSERNSGSGGLAPQPSSVSNVAPVNLVGSKHQRMEPTSAPVVSHAHPSRQPQQQPQQHQPMFNLGGAGGLTKIMDLKIAMTQNPTGMAPMPQQQPTHHQQQPMMASNSGSATTAARSAPLPTAAPGLGGGGLDMPQWGSGGSTSLQMPQRNNGTTNNHKQQQDAAPQEANAATATTSRGRKSAGQKKGGTYKLSI